MDQRHLDELDAKGYTVVPDAAPPELFAAIRTRILELAERNARLALDQDRLRSELRRSQRIEAPPQPPAISRIAAASAIAIAFRGVGIARC